MKIHKSILTFLVTISFTHLSLAQPKGEDIVIGQSFSLTSEILQEERPYIVYLPEDYSENGDPISVMYLLDGDYHFHHTTGVISFLKNNNRIPDMMVVAIPNTTDRTRDLTPKIEQNLKTARDFPTGGGADKMLSFLRDELIPFIDTTYNTNSYKILTGHSFGGLFAVYTLLSEPNLFDAYISISPAMFWDDQNLVEKAKSFLNDKPDLDSYFYMTMGDEGGTMLGGAMKLAALFEEMDNSKFKWDFKVMEEETHGSIPHRSTYYGLEAIFKGWFSIDYKKIYAQGGIPEIRNHFNNISEKLGYKVLPSENELNSLGYAMLANKKIEEAKEIFIENINLFPSSYNVYDSAAEAYMENGENNKAISNYEKSMELNPGNKNGIEMLKKLGVTYDPAKYAVALDKAEQTTFTGEYTVSTGGVLSIQIEGDELTASHPALPKQSMIYYWDNLFLLVPNNIPVKFTVDDKNMPDGFDAQMAIGFNVQGKKKN